MGKPLLREEWMFRFYELAKKYGVEDIEVIELIYANSACESGSKTPEQVVEKLGWTRIASA